MGTAIRTRFLNAAIFAGGVLGWAALGCQTAHGSDTVDALEAPSGSVVEPLRLGVAEIGTAWATARVPAAADLMPDPEPEACPDGMALVEGASCTKVKHRCLKWMDPEGRYRYFRCAKYAEPKCVGQRQTMRYCIDKREFTQAGESLPANHQSLTKAIKACGSQGKRVCQNAEWTFACEGEEMRPYPYGFERDASACNADRKTLQNGDGHLVDMRQPSGSKPRCESPFGVMDMTGNLEEMVQRNRRGPPQLIMKGAYWQPGRNTCRGGQTKHDAHYNGTETGFRCCADAS